MTTPDSAPTETSTPARPFLPCPSWCELPERLCGFASTDCQGHDVRLHYTGRVVAATDAWTGAQASVHVDKDEMRQVDSGAETWGPAQISVTLAKAHEDGEVVNLTPCNAEHLAAALLAAVRRAAAIDSDPRGTI